MTYIALSPVGMCSPPGELHGTHYFFIPVEDGDGCLCGAREFHGDAWYYNRRPWQLPHRPALKRQPRNLERDTEVVMLALLGYRRKDIADYIGIDKSNITRILNGAGQGRVALRVGRVLHELIKATT